MERSTNRRAASASAAPTTPSPGSTSTGHSIFPQRSLAAHRTQRESLHAQAVSPLASSDPRATGREAEAGGNSSSGWPTFTPASSRETAPVTPPLPTFVPAVPLTPCEQKVARLISLGCTVAEAARILFRSPNTVDNHKAKAAKKLGAHNLAEFTRRAILVGATSLRDALTEDEQRLRAERSGKAKPR